MISVIIPIYNEGIQIYTNITKIKSILSENNIEHQFILIDDGSYDNSFKEMEKLYKKYDNISLIRFSRNFGKEAALCAGLENCSGDACLILDADLQHPPELIPKMVYLWNKEGYEVVEGVKQKRGKESLISKIAALTFYKLFNKSSGINLNNSSDFKLLDRKVIEAWKSMKESITFFRGMSAWIGFKHIQIPFEVKERKNGKSKWSFKSLIKLAVDSITSYSSLPLHIVTIFGILMFFISIFLSLRTLFMKITNKVFNRSTAVITIILFTGSCILLNLSIICIYISKIYDEVKKRPRYIIANKRGNGFNEKK